MFAGNDMIGALGAEIDRLENEIRTLVPGIRHIDLVRLSTFYIALSEWVASERSRQGTPLPGSSCKAAPGFDGMTAQRLVVIMCLKCKARSC